MGTLSLAAPLVLFEKSRLWAGTGFHLLPSFHHHCRTQHKNTTQTVTLTITPTSTFSRTLPYTDTHSTRNVVCPSGTWFENRPHLTPSIHLVWNPHVIVQWVGIGAYTHCIRRRSRHRQSRCMYTRSKWGGSNCRKQDFLANDYHCGSISAVSEVKFKEGDLWNWALMSPLDECFIFTVNCAINTWQTTVPQFSALFACSQENKRLDKR